MKKILGLALYGPLAASNRVRLGQYREGLAKAGIDLRIQSLLGNDYLKARFEGKQRPIIEVLRSTLERTRILASKERFDLAIVHCELFPFLPALLERVLVRIPFVYDFDDAFYLRYTTGKFACLNPILGRKFEQVMGAAAAITAGNRYLAKYASAFNKDVTLLPSVVDTERYIPIENIKDETFTVGWIGSPSTEKYLKLLVPPLRELGRDLKLRLTVVGGRAPPIEGVEIIHFPWSEETEVDLINSFDVGVMPLPDDEWARGKCAFKLIQYMACGVPVVASRVGANIDLVTEDCGFLVSTSDEWVEAIRKLFLRTLTRKNMGVASRRRVIKYYSLHNNLPVLFDVVIRKLGRG